MGAARGQAFNIPTSLHDLQARGEPLLLNLASDLVQLLSLGFSDTLDVQHLLLGAHQDGEHRAETRCLELQDVAHINSVLLHLVDFMEGLNSSSKSSLTAVSSSAMIGSSTF